MGKLIPTPVVDKNGKLTTVHKKVSDVPSVPTLGSVAPKLVDSVRPAQESSYKPTAQQLRQENRDFQVIPTRIDPGLYPTNRTRLTIKASDVELYEVFAFIKDSANALACMDNCGGMPDTVFLDRFRLSHLVNTDPERVKMMRAALELRIPADSFAEFDMKFSAYNDMPTYLDAAQAYAIPTLKKINGFVDEVRRGTVSMADVMEVGMKPITNIKRYSGDAKVIEIMQKLADGSANYTASEVKAIFNRCGRASAVHVMMALMERNGGEFAASIKSPDLAHDISLLCDGDGIDYAEAVSYADKFRLRAFRNHRQVYNLFRAGVDLDFAVEHSAKVDEYSVQQIIALHEGIAKPVTGGWL